MSEERINKKVEDMVENISYNTSSGSFARDIISAVGIEMVKEEDDYSLQLDTRLIDTATGNNLDICGADKAINRLGATKATGTVKITGVNGSIIKKGNIVINGSNAVEYEILEEKTIENISTIVKIQCRKVGTIGNCEIGQINKFAEEYVGLSKVENLENILDGTDMETDESFRMRIQNYIRKPRISWNQYIFEDRAKEVQGVEHSHCIPRWNGAGTVKIIITEINKEIVTDELKEKVKNYIELKIISDIDLTVEGVELYPVDIVLNATISSDFNEEAAKTRLKENLNNFFFDNLFKDKIYYFDIVESIQHSGCISKLGNISVDGNRNDIELNENKLCKVNSIVINSL
ncbi:baseplate J/gp47 family protein [Fusobacterium ulcerans]|uniref:baseplate J/gp47 family protein n=1 Tax=Fusobacterium ulcerans TaxID=861 RepID=UPI0026EDBBF7|nr:baseplate J/gp47 family protein [Fusobacterium ulcerans]